MSTSSSMVAVGRGVVAAATVVVLVDVGVVVVAAGPLDADGVGGIAMLEVEAAVVDEGAIGAEGEVEFAVVVEPVRVGAFVPAALVALLVVQAAMLIRPVARTATPTWRRN